MAEIYNDKSNKLLNGTSGNDTINNGAYFYENNKYVWHDGGSKVTIKGGAGDDRIKNFGVKASIDGGEGNDYIANGNYRSSLTAINGGNGNDYIDNFASKVTIIGGNGNDSILNGSAYTQLDSISISGGAGDDFVYNDGCSKTTIDTGSGNDSIRNWSSNITIIGGKDNDTIYNDWNFSTDSPYGTSLGSNVVFKYNSGDGDDIIYGIKSDSTVQIATNDGYTTQKSGNDIIIKVGNGKMTLKDGANKSFKISTVKGGDNGSTLPSGVSYNKAKTALTVKAPFTGELNLSNYDSNVVTVDASRDTKFVTIKGNAKNNVIKAGTGGSSLYGQGGDDSLYGGSGVDTFYYGDGQGNDVIVNYTVGKDKIKLTSGSIKSSSLSGTDVILNIGNGSIKVKNAVGKEITVIDSKGKSSTKVYGSTTRPNQKSQQQVIKDFMAVMNTTTLKGVKALDAAIKQVSNGFYNSTIDLIKNYFLADVLKEKTTIIKDVNSYKFLRDYCGIVLSNEDTGAITGSDVSGKSSDLKTKITIVPEKETLIKINEKDSQESFNELKTKNKDIDKNGRDLIFTKNGLTIKIPKYYKNKTSYETILSEDKLNIINGLYSWWISSSLDLIEESYGLSFKGENLLFQESTLKFYDKEKEDVFAYFNFQDKSLNINLARFKSIDLNSDKNGKATSITDSFEYADNWFLDRTIAHELTHAVMNANIKNFDKFNMPLFFIEGSAELIHGADDQRKIDPIVWGYANGSYKTLEKSLSTNAFTGNLINDLTEDAKFSYASGYMLLRYFAKQVSNNSGLPNGVYYSGDQKTLNVKSPYKGTIDIKDYAAYTNNTLNIDASQDKNTLTIIGNDKSNILKAGTGGSSLYGQSGDDTLYGGSGKDTFFYANGDGKDVIYNYTAGKDKIKLTSGSIKSYEISGTDIILNIGNGSIKIKNSAHRKITIIDSNDNETTTVYGNSKKVSSLWFADDTNFSTSSAQIDSITQNGLSDYSLGNVDANTDWTALTPTDSLTSALTFSDK